MVLSTVLAVVLGVYLVAAALYIIRIVRGPTVPDMVLSVNCLSYDLCVFMCVLAVLLRSPILVLGALCLALWAYLLDLAVAKYLEGRELGE